MVTFTNAHRGDYGVERICGVLPMAPSTYYEHKAQAADPGRRAARVKRDERLRAHLRRVYDEHHQVYGAEKVWRQLRREEVDGARCTVERLMRLLGLKGAVRGRAFKVTPSPTSTRSDRATWSNAPSRPLRRTGCGWPT